MYNDESVAWVKIVKVGWVERQRNPPFHNNHFINHKVVASVGWVERQRNPPFHNNHFINHKVVVGALSSTHSTFF